MTNNSQLNQELKNKVEEVKNMNTNQVQENKGLNVLSNENAKSVAVSTVAVAGTTTRKSFNEDPRDDATYYLLKDTQKLYTNLGWNNDKEWNNRQRPLYDKLIKEVETVKEEIEELQLMTKQDNEIKEINQQLKETPVANITIEFAEKGQFSIVNTQTKQVITTNTADVIKSTIAVMSSIKPISENNNQV